MENIVVHNASENNLKNITVKLPINKFTCITGPSGCGKSSLVYDTIYAESQRSFLESVSGNLFGQKLMDKPAVDSIENLDPDHISISGKGCNESYIRAYIKNTQIGKTCVVNPNGTFNMYLPKIKPDTIVTLKMRKTNYVTANKNIIIP